jgi:hypothetical protein
MSVSTGFLWDSSVFYEKNPPAILVDTYRVVRLPVLSARTDQRKGRRVSFNPPVFNLSLVLSLSMLGVPKSRKSLVVSLETLA